MIQLLISTGSQLRLRLNELYKNLTLKFTKMISLHWRKYFNTYSSIAERMWNVSLNITVFSDICCLSYLCRFNGENNEITHDSSVRYKISNSEESWICLLTCGLWLKLWMTVVIFLTILYYKIMFIRSTVLMTLVLISCLYNYTALIFSMQLNDKWQPVN